MATIKHFLAITIALFTLTTFAQSKMNPQSWEEQSKKNKALLPKYGYLEKSDKEKKADEKLIEDMMILPYYNGDRRIASESFIRFGWKFLQQGDLKTAMFRFNQTYILDSTNTNLLVDLGIYYWQRYFGLRSKDKKSVLEKLKIGIKYLLKSYNFDHKHQKTLFNLSICYFAKGDCGNAWKYHNECKALGGRTIPDK
jgi:hypothetical protein